MRVSATRDDRRNRSRQAHNSQTPNFSEGDFVLFGVRDDSNRARRSKLYVRWTGPYRISAVFCDWHYQLQNIVSADTVEAHVTRIKFYHDSSLNVTKELKAFASSNMRFIVNSLLNARLDHGQWQLLVNWAGFPDDENSWEPTTVLVEDVPDLVKAFVRAHLANPDVRRMSEDLAIL